MYTVDYFINKFEKIPEENFCVRMHDQINNECHCYIGHCSVSEGEHKALGEELLFHKLGISAGGLVHGIEPKYSHLSLKQRILAALRDIKKIQQPTYTDITKDLAVLPVDKIETDLPVKELIKESEVSDETWD